MHCTSLALSISYAAYARSLQGTENHGLVGSPKCLPIRDESQLVDQRPTRWFYDEQIVWVDLTGLTPFAFIVCCELLNIRATKRTQKAMVEMLSGRFAPSLCRPL